MKPIPDLIWRKEKHGFTFTIKEENNLKEKILPYQDNPFYIFHNIRDMKSVFKWNKLAKNSILIDISFSLCELD